MKSKYVNTIATAMTYMPTMKNISLYRETMYRYNYLAIHLERTETAYEFT